MIRRVNHNRVIGIGEILQYIEYPSYVVIDEGNHPEVVRDHVRELLIGLRYDARNALPMLSQSRVGDLRLAFERGAVPPRSSVEVEPPLAWQLDRVVRIQTAPGLRWRIRMVRVWERGPDTKWPVTVTCAQHLDRAVGNPGTRVPGGRKC